jgi:hypothetical protein
MRADLQLRNAIYWIGRDARAVRVCIEEARLLLRLEVDPSV